MKVHQENLIQKKKEEDNVSSKSRTSSGTVRKSRWDQISPTDPPHEDSKMTKILNTRKSGLRGANVLMQENEFFRQQENEFFKNTPGFSGEDIVPIVRDRKTGKILDLKKEEEEAKIKQEKENETKVKYNRWGMGLKQVEEATEKLSSDLHEMSKPLDVISIER